jgi:outer membrane receptor protein involved in Fe transport
VEPLETRNEFADDLSWAKGKHMIKLGVSFENVQDDVNYLSNRYGSYTYPTVNAFAEDYSGNTTGARDYSAFTQTFGNPVVDYGVKDIGIYLQDQWKATDRLTVTLGARYEYTFMPPPAQTNPLFPITGESLPSGTRDLAPRLGACPSKASRGIGTDWRN